MSACVRAYFVVCHLQACQQRYVSERPPARFQTSSADDRKKPIAPRVACMVCSVQVVSASQLLVAQAQLRAQLRVRPRPSAGALKATVAQIRTYLRTYLPMFRTRSLDWGGGGRSHVGSRLQAYI